jgi:DNA-binding winged helix-turn-helix (wHTH) protein
MQNNSHNPSPEPQKPLPKVSEPVNCYFCEEISITPDLGQIKVAEHEARLTPINMKVLTVLLENAGKVVTRSEIDQLVWPNQIVSDDTLTRAISDIRAVFKSLSPQHKIIETIPKKGYRWLLECSSESKIDFKDNQQSVTTQTEKPKLEQRKPDSIVTQRTHFNFSNWFRWALWGTSGVVFFSLLAVSTIWLVKNQFSDRFIKVAMMPIEGETPAHKEVVEILREKLQQEVLKTKDIRFLSSRMGYLQQQSLIPYLAEEFAVSWLIEVEIRQSAGLAKITLNLVDAQSAVVLESVSQKIQSEQLDTESLVVRFIESTVRISSSRMD